MTAPWRILSLPPIAEDVVRHLFDPLGDAVEVTFPQTRDRDGLIGALPDADIVIADFSGELALDAEAVRAAPRLAFVQMPAVGTDSIDVAALTEAGVPVANAAGFNARGVAEWAVAAAFALCRHLAWADRGMRAGGWPQMDVVARRPREIHTQRVGVVGFGAIGAEAARLFAALGCSVSYWTRRPRPEAVAQYRELDDLLATSDILVLALPLTDETRGLIGPERLALLPNDAAGERGARGIVLTTPSSPLWIQVVWLGRPLTYSMRNPCRRTIAPLPRERAALSACGGHVHQSQLNLVSVVRDNVTAAVQGRDVKNVVNGMKPQVADVSRTFRTGGPSTSNM